MRAHRNLSVVVGNPRTRILDTAARLFVEKGFQQTRLTEIARHAGVARSTLYELFANKDAILVAINDQLIEQSLHLEQEMLNDDDEPETALRNWFLAIYRVDDSYKNLLRIMYSDEVQPSLLLNRDAIGESVTQAGTIVRRILRKGIKSGAFRADLNIARTARALQGLYYFLTRQLVTDYPVVELDAGHAEDVIQLALNGLVSRR